MKLLLLLIILVIFTPIAIYGQVSMNEIKIETVQDNIDDAKVILDSTDLLVTINGDLYDNGLVNLVVRGNFGPGSADTMWESYTFTENNPSHVFELDFPFQTNEVYLVDVNNGMSETTIYWVPLPGAQEDQQTKVVLSALEENKSLKPEIEKKDAVIMEQIKVIQNLAAKVNNADYEESNSKLHFVTYTHEDSKIFQSLVKENDLLKNEIEKKNAVIMEQIKVIQDLALKFEKTDFEYGLSYYSLV